MKLKLKQIISCKLKWFLPPCLDSIQEECLNDPTTEKNSEKEQLIASFGEQKGPTEIEENCQLQDIAAISNSSPKQQPRTEDELALPASLYSVQEMNLMISKAQQSTSSKNQTLKSSKAGSPILSSQEYKGMENANEDGMITKTNSAAHSYGNIRGSSEALTTKNSFDMLSELDATHSPQLSVNGIQTELQFEALSMPSTKEKSSGIDKFSIQTELRNMSLDPKAQLGEYISDKVFEEKFTPAKKITRTRRPKQILDL